MNRFIITIALVILAEFYSFILIRSLVRPLSGAWKTGIVSIYIILSVLAWAGIVFFRVINWAELPHTTRNIYVAFTLGLFVGKLLMLTIMLLDDVRRIIYWAFLKIFPIKATVDVVASTGVGIPRSVFLKRTALLIGATAVSGFMYGITNRYNYKIKRIKLSFPNLPEAFRGMKMVQISDVHSGSFDSHEAVARGINMILQEQADIVFFTGDLVNNKHEEIVPYMDIFSKLKAPLGVYSVLGNHDYGDYEQWSSAEAKAQNLDKLKAIHGEMGWRLMMNEHIVLEKGNDKIAIVGIENWSAKPQFPKYGDMAKAYSGLSEKNIPFKVLLSHDPSHWDAQVIPQYKDIDLMLAGHTHGMQFGIEIPGFKWSPVKYVYKKWAGLYQEGKQYLYVNRGYGFLGYPGRLGILPEITVFELS